MIHNLNEVDNEELNKFIEISLQELKDFFELGEVQTPNLIILNNRKSIIDLRGKEKGEWLVGWASPDINSVFILDKSKFGTESKTVYTDNQYNKLLKHELTHILYHYVSNNRLPAWLAEGIAIYLSGQYLKKPRPTEFKNFLDFYNEGQNGVYEESGFVVEELIKQFGKEKLLELIKSLKSTKTEKEFFKSFKKIYGFDLSYETLKISNK